VGWTANLLEQYADNRLIAARRLQGPAASLSYRGKEMTTLTPTSPSQGGVNQTSSPNGEGRVRGRFSHARPEPHAQADRRASRLRKPCREEIALRVDSAAHDTTATWPGSIRDHGFPASSLSVVTYIDHNVYQTDSRNTDDIAISDGGRATAPVLQAGQRHLHQVHFESFSVPASSSSHGQPTPLCGSTVCSHRSAGSTWPWPWERAYHLPMPRCARHPDGELKPWCTQD